MVEACDDSKIIWYQSDQNAVTCKEKIKILDENYHELQQIMQDCFDDAILVGVDDEFMRIILKKMVDKLRSPVL